MAIMAMVLTIPELGRERPMKALKSLLFCFACTLVVLLAGAITCSVRAKYRSLPTVKAAAAYSYVPFLGEYSFLQYNQAGGEQGRTALLEYLTELQKIQTEKVRYPKQTLGFDSALTYLRLYRLELATGSSSKAEDYLGAAQKELSSIGWKDVSPDHLIKAIQTREIEESRLYNSKKNIAVPVAEQ